MGMFAFNRARRQAKAKREEEKRRNEVLAKEQLAASRKRAWALLERAEDKLLDIDREKSRQAAEEDAKDEAPSEVKEAPVSPIDSDSVALAPVEQAEAPKEEDAPIEPPKDNKPANQTRQNRSNRTR